MAEHDAILAAQKEFYEAINGVRKELSDDAKQMRAELMVVFQEAHRENKESMKMIADNLAQSIMENQMHAKEDNKRFDSVNRIVYMALGAFGIISLAVQVYAALK